METPPGLAKFDSATAMVRALGNLLHGRDFSGLGQPATLRRVVRFADCIPRRPRGWLFARLGAQEGVKPGQVESVDSAEVARWITGQYPRRSYPAVLIGSSNGALVHMAAAFGIPWLPQTFLTLMRHRGDPDDATEPMRAAMEPAQRLLATNPDVQLHHMHDPVQDRLMLRYITYFRFKYRCLPAAYRQFLRDNLAPGGTIVIVDCRQRWPVTRLGDRHVYQFGAVGGATCDEYFRGSERIAAYLERYQSTLRQWHPPTPDEDSSEAEWGFEPALEEAVIEFAKKHNYRVLRLRFAEPESLSPAVADFHRRWYGERGIDTNRLLFESFIVHEPYWALRTGTVPFWMTFNKAPSLQAARDYLETVDPYDDLYLTLFAHGINSVGLPPIGDWQHLLSRARRHGELLGVNARTYPAHFSVFGQYSEKLRQLSPHYPLPEPLSPDRLHDFVNRWSEP